MEDLFEFAEMLYNAGGIGGYFAFVNVLTFAAFAVDKFQARTKGWRISEKILLGLSALGGALGGFISMEVFRHKTKKPVFKFGLPVMILVHIAIAGIIFVI